MKKVAILLCLVLCMAASAGAAPSAPDNVRYRLFPTQNMWTFLKLDTMTGKIWQVQYSVEGAKYRFETVLNSVDLARRLKQERVVGRFMLYATQNTYNFVLLDQIDGYTYQVQWNGDADQRFVIPISD
ncbi:MAG: hypothetical protein VZQ49_00585 [Methanobrevibacter sp.]|nr:hypothetical protein [Methanobrevibacter sp.]